MNVRNIFLSYELLTENKIRKKSLKVFTLLALVMLLKSYAFIRIAPEYNDSLIITRVQVGL